MAPWRRAHKVCPRSDSLLAKHRLTLDTVYMLLKRSDARNPSTTFTMSVHSLATPSALLGAQNLERWYGLEEANLIPAFLFYFVGLLGSALAMGSSSSSLPC